MRDLSSRLDEEVANATKAAKNNATKLQARVGRGSLLGTKMFNH